MTSVHSKRPWGEISRDFLTEHQREFLTSYAAGTLNWEPGRQGTGYEKLNIRRMLSCSEIHQFAHNAVDWVAGADPDEFEDVWGSDRWDLYLIRYPVGSYIPPHKDPAPGPGRHRRVNAIVNGDAPGECYTGRGTRFYLEWEGELVRPMLKPGDAVLFDPSELTHGVDPREVERLVISCGVYVPLRGTLAAF